MMREAALAPGRTVAHAARLTVLLALALAVVPDTSVAQDRPAPPGEHLLAKPGMAGWSVDQRSGCWLWNAVPQAGETVQWSGGCGPDARATGPGTAEWRSNGMTSRFEGEYRDGRLHGRGVYVWSNGNRYDGDWRDHRRHGRGVFTWASGDRFEGEYRNNMRHGHGVFTTVAGHRHEGEYQEDQRHGKGISTWANGDRHEGEWRNGLRHGRGVFTWASGDRYEGQYLYGWPDGAGEALIGGTRFSGRWAFGCTSDGVSRAAIGRPVAECH